MAYGGSMRGDTSSRRELPSAISHQLGRAAAEKTLPILLA
jgi:hypothetical protein